MSKYKEIDITKITPVSVRTRDSKVENDQMASVPQPGMKLSDFIKGLPPVLASADFKFIVQKIADARMNDKPVLLMMGAHVIKTGLGPVIIDLMENGILQ